MKQRRTLLVLVLIGLSFSNTHAQRKAGEIVYDRQVRDQVIGTDPLSSLQLSADVYNGEIEALIMNYQWLQDNQEEVQQIAATNEAVARQLVRASTKLERLEKRAQNGVDERNLDSIHRLVRKTNNSIEDLQESLTGV